MPPASRDPACISNHDPSPELGSPSLKIQYSKRTGRPIRKSAGKVKAKAGFVDSRVIEEEYEEPIETPSEDEDGEIKPQPKRKRKRSPSPKSPPLDDVIRNEVLDDFSDNEISLQKKPRLPPIIMQFNIPLGFHGPLHVKLDRSMLGLDVTHNLLPGRTTRKISTISEPQPAGDQKKPVGFTDLPAELRNKVYRHLFVIDKILEFPPDLPPTDLTVLNRSSQFLSTCKLVYSEGCSILYGENRFKFDRNGKTRGSFWEPVLKEIGYKDVRQFLKMIGPENLVYLRDVTLTLQDAMPGATPQLDHEGRRYVRDEHLLDVIRTLRQAKLRTFSLTFLGRRALCRLDTRFVHYLSQIKADEISSTQNGWYHPKVEHHLWKEMKETMTRKKKLYLVEQQFNHGLLV